jgi:hypothetical protein
MPLKSKAQQRAMFAAASGHSTIGIPEKVGKEFTQPYVGHPGSLKELPARKKKVKIGYKKY